MYLIRKSTGRYSRPQHAGDIVRMLRTHQFEVGDEICESASYWFSVTDIQEIRNHFGDAAVPERVAGSGEDWTITDVPHLERTAEVPQDEPETSVLLRGTLIALLLLALLVLVVVKISVRRYS